MRIFKKIYPEKGETLESISQGIILSQLLGRYLARKNIMQASLEYFQDIPTSYDEAVAFFLDKLVMGKEEFQQLEKAARRQAFTVAKLEKINVIKSVKESLDEVLKIGGMVDSWKDEMDMLFDSLGLTRLNNYYLDNIFRTNMQEALNQGKDAIYRETSQDEFPLMQWITIEDDRVRPEHAALHGFTAPVDDPIWLRLRAPLSYNCRCTRTLVHKDEKIKESSWRPTLSGRGFEFVS